MENKKKRKLNEETKEIKLNEKYYNDLINKLNVEVFNVKIFFKKIKFKFLVTK